jgi:hypothetical protein
MNQPNPKDPKQGMPKQNDPSRGQSGQQSQQQNRPGQGGGYSSPGHGSQSGQSAPADKK